MNISAWSIRSPVPSILLFVMLTFCGLLAFQKLAVQNFPDIDLPTIKIAASLEGAAPSQLETEVARKIEDSLASLSRIGRLPARGRKWDSGVSISSRLKSWLPTSTSIGISRCTGPGKARQPDQLEWRRL